MPKARTQKKKCKTCPSKSVVARGLCHRCYMAAKATISRGEHSEDELISAGLIDAPKQAGGRPARSGFAEALAKRGKP